MNRVAFTFLNFNIYWYSLCILFGILIAYFIITKEAKKHNINHDLMVDIIFYTIIVGIIGARGYYLIFNMNYYINNLSQVFAIWNGGLAIHGGIIAGLIFVYFYTKNKNIGFLKLLDIVTPGVIIAQAFGRWGNFFNGEAHGGITTLETLKNLCIPDFVINGMYINENYYYPTFYFESIWCVIGFLIMIIIRNRKNIRIGFISGFYFIWYGVGRFFIESLRTDSLMFFNIKAAQIVSILSIILGIILIIKSKNNEKYKEDYNV